MRTAPTTRLKGDLLLELKEVRLKINIENNLLSIVREKRKQRESNFAERDAEFKIREATNNRLEKKFNSVANNADLYFDEVTKSTVLKRKALKILETRESKILNDIKKINTERDLKTKYFNKEIKDKRKVSESLDETILKKRSLITATEKKNNDLKEENIIITEKNVKVAKGLSDREITVTTREIENEHKKSELRIWAVRLNKRYGEYMNKHEKILIEKYI